jgi:hypothetical protein
MSLTVRMIAKNGVTVTGWAGPPDNAQSRRYYTASAGGTVDVPAGGDADAMPTFGLIAIGNGSGPTSSRPNGMGGVNPGYLYLDTTLGIFVAWTGAGWVNPITGASA